MHVIDMGMHQLGCGNELDVKAMNNQVKGGPRGRWQGM
jgi:hypothetical protein